MTWYEALPKIELHIHLEGAIPHHALFELIEKYGGDSSIPHTEALTERFEYRDFPQFIETWSGKNHRGWDRQDGNVGLRDISFL